VVMIRETGSDVSRSLGPGQSVEEVAEAIARAIHRPLPEEYAYVELRGLVLLNALAPGFTDRFVQRFGRKPIKGQDTQNPRRDRQDGRDLG